MVCDHFRSLFALSESSFLRSGSHQDCKVSSPDRHDIERDYRELDRGFIVETFMPKHYQPLQVGF